MFELFKSSPPPRYEDRSGAPEWPPEALDGLKELDAEIARLKSRRQSYLRDKAYELGLAAKELEDLRSERGNPFAPAGRNGYRSAREEDDEGRPLHDEEWAYWCGYKGFGQDDDYVGCGWVRGIPRSEPYDDLGPLSGSAGERHYCQICGLRIGETRHVLS